MPKIKFQVGRKRRAGKREPNGRLLRERGVDPKAIAQLQPHRRLVPAEVAHDPKAESIIGRLSLNGWITEEEYQSAVKYREIIMRYRAAIDAPKSTESSMSGVIVGPWGRSLEIDDAERLRRKEVYDAAFNYVEERRGNRGARALAHALHDRRDFSVPELICALCALCEHFSFTNSRKCGLCH